MARFDLCLNCAYDNAHECVGNESPAAARLAANARSLRGSLDATAFSPAVRQALGVSAARGRIDYALNFPILPCGAVAIAGELDAALETRCQRCLEPFALALNVPVRLIIAVATAMTEPPTGWELGDPELHPRLADLIEQELLLALPISPRHPPEDCRRG